MAHSLSTIAASLLLALLAPAASGACLNKFVKRSDGARQVVTLLTGKLTFQEAQTLSAAINRRDAPPLEWLDDEGKIVARQFGELKVLRPMPVGCDGKKSGVVLAATFGTRQQPARTMTVRLTPDSVVAFQEQAQ